MITKLRITIRLQPENPIEYRVCTVSNREVLAKLNKAEMLLYTAGLLRLMPEQVIKWEKAPEEFYQADKLIELMLADGFVYHDSETMAAEMPAIFPIPTRETVEIIST